MILLSKYETKIQISAKSVEEAKELASKVQSWLKEYGKEHNLNYKGNKCVEIEKQVKDNILQKYGRGI